MLVYFQAPQSHLPDMCSLTYHMAYGKVRPLYYHCQLLELGPTGADLEVQHPTSAFLYTDYHGTPPQRICRTSPDVEE